MPRTSAFHDVAVGNNSVVELDALNNPVSIPGFNAGPGWDATTGLGSPSADQLADYLYFFASDGDGPEAIAGSNPHGQGHPEAPRGKVRPH